MLNQDLSPAPSKTLEELEREARIRQEEQLQARKLRAQKELRALDEEDERGYFADVAVGVVQGSRDAVAELLDWSSSATEWFSENVAELGTITIDGDGIGYTFEKVEGRGLRGDVLPETPETETLPGDMVRGVTQFLTGFALTRKVAPLSNTNRATRLVAQSAMTDAVFFDPHEQRLSNLVESNPDLRNPITGYLRADPEDSEAEGRMKNALEGMGIGFALDGMLKSLKFIKESYDGVRLADGLEGIDKSIFEESEQFRNTLRAEMDKPIKVDTEVTPTREPEEITVRDGEEAVEEAPKSIQEQVSEAFSVSPEGRAKIAEVLGRGQFTEAPGLIDFNAAKFDWESVGDADSVRGVLNTVSDILAKDIDDAKGGVQTWAQTKQLADLVGGDPRKIHQLYSEVRDGPGLSARMLAAEKTMIASAERIRLLARTAAETQADADFLKLHKQVEIHSAIQAEVKGSQSEIARAMNAMKILRSAESSASDILQKATDEVSNAVGVGRGRNRRTDASGASDEVREAIRQATGGGKRGDSLRLAQTLRDLEDLGAINRATRKSAWEKGRDIFLEHYINGLLSSLKTLNLNNISNTLKVFEAGMERYLSVGIGGVRKALGSKADRTSLREANAFAYGTMEGLRDALKIPFKGMRDQIRKDGIGSFKDVIRDNEEKWGSVFRSWVKEQPILDQRNKFEEGTRKAIHVPEDVIKTYSKPGRAMAKMWNGYGNFIRLPGRDIQASDELFKSMAYRQELRALAYRRADEIAEAEGLSGAQRQQRMSEEMEKILKNPPEDMHIGGISFARYQTFQSDLGNIGSAVENFRRKVPLTAIAIPFVRTPINIMKQALLERSPIALLRRSMWDDIRRGGREADLAVARLTMGTSLWGMGFMWASEGLITGGSDWKSTGKMDGVEPYSIKLGDTWYQYNRLEPLGMLLGTAADAYQISERGLSAENDSYADYAGEAAVVGITAISENVLSKTWMMGVADFFDAMTDPERNMAGYAKQLTASTVPYSSFLRTAARDEDPIAREAFDYIDNIRRNIPGLSDELPPRRDYLGRVIQNTQALGPEWASPIAISKESDNPVDQELSRLDFRFRMPSKAINGVPLNAEQYSRLLELRGQVIKAQGQNLEDALREVISSPIYKSMPDGEYDMDGGKEMSIKRVVSEYTRAARKKLVEEYPELEEELIRKEEKRESLLQPQ